MRRNLNVLLLLMALLLTLIPGAWAEPTTPTETVTPSPAPSKTPDEKEEPNYYLPYLKGDRTLGFAPDMALFRRVRDQIRDNFVDDTTDKQLLEGVRTEVGKLLEQAKVDPSRLSQLPADEHLPDAIVDAYGDKVNKDLIWYAMIRGELASCKDPYSVLMPPDEFEHMMSSMEEKKFGGVGIYIELDKDNSNRLTIVEPIEGTPAYNSGLQPGDVIAQIEGKSTDGMTLDAAATMLRGPQGSKVHVTIDRKGQDRKDYELTRADIRPVSVSSKMLDGNIGYVRLRLFGEKSAIEMQDAISKLKQQGMKSIILDLRNNGGGYITTAQDICSMFLKPGELIVSVEQRSAPPEQYRAKPTEEGGVHMPMVLLVNAFSASASEITAGCLKDLGVATLVGVKTFGKGSVQNVMRLPQGAALKLTIAHFFSPKHNIIHHVGITPDVDIPMEARLVGHAGDTQLAKAIDILKGNAATTPTTEVTGAGGGGQNH